MPSFEQVCQKVFSQPQWQRKLFIGGVLSFIPVANFLAFGFLYQIAKRIRLRQDLELPEWEKWDKLFLDGLRFFSLFCPFFLLPVGCGYLFSKVLLGISFGYAGIFAYVPICPIQ